MRREVIREGVPTMDGRFIERGAVVLPDEPLPIMDYDILELPGIHDVLAVTGTAENFTREDDGRIYCDVDIVDPRTMCVGLVIDDRTVVGGEELSIAKAEIVSCMISSHYIYPWKDDE